MQPSTSFKVGIYGGAFDPPTIGHRYIVDSILASNLVDAVWVVPSCAHVYAKKMESFENRLAMCVAMFSNDLRIQVYPGEKCLHDGINGVATVSLLTHLDEQYPNVQFVPIIGKDNADTIGQWIDGARLIEKYPFIIVPRQGSADCQNKWYLKEPHTYLTNVKELNVSSTMLRDALICGDDARISELTIADVIYYIKRHKLYSTFSHRGLDA